MGLSKEELLGEQGDRKAVAFAVVTSIGLGDFRAVGQTRYFGAEVFFQTLLKQVGLSSVFEGEYL